MACDKTLSGIRLLSTLTSDELAELEGGCSWRRYRLGERVFDRGSEAHEVYFVIEGGVNVVNFARAGDEVAFAIAKSGDIFGEMAAIDGGTRSASVVANEDSLLALLPCEQFVELLKRHGEICFLLLQRLSFKVREVGEKVMRLSTMGTESRLCAVLLELAERDESVPDLWVLRPMPSLRELAREISASQTEIGAALNTLYESGLLRRKGESLYLMDRKSLQEIVDAA